MVVQGGAAPLPWIPNTTTTAGFWRYFQFQADQVPNWADLFNLFDSYKISALKYEFHPRFDSFSGNDTTDTTLPGTTNQAGTRIHIVNDPYSTIVPSGIYNSATLNAFMENGQCKSYSGNRVVTVYCKPTINLTTEAGNNMRRRASWLNVTNLNVHNCFHAFVQDPGLTGVFGNSFDVYCTVYMMLRNIR